MASKEQNAALEAAIKKIKGDGLTFFKMDDLVDVLYPHIPTNVFGIDHYACGIGGLPRGRIIEIIGPSSSGKTTLTLQTIASAQRLEDNAAFVDAEHALDPTYAAALGANMKKLLIAQPDNGEQALQAVVDLVDSASVGVVAVDSVASLVPQAELDGEMSDAHVGLQARLMGKALRKIAGRCNKTGTTVIFLNQIREKIGVTFGSNETTPGGRALPFYASMRIDIRRLAQIKEGDVNAGNKTKVKIIKNKMAPPFREVEVGLMFGEGLDDAGSLTAFAIANNVWKKSGSTYTFDGTSIVGKDHVVELIKADAAAYSATFKATLKAMGKSEVYIKAVSNG